MSNAASMRTYHEGRGAAAPMTGTVCNEEHNRSNNNRGDAFIFIAGSMVLKIYEVGAVKNVSTLFESLVQVQLWRNFYVLLLFRLLQHVYFTNESLLR